MVDLSKFNGRKSVFNITDSEEFRFIKKSDLNYDYKYYLKGVYKSIGKFGSQTVYMFTDDFGKKYRFSVNGDTADIITSDNEMIKSINDGIITIKFYQYKSKKFNKDCIGVTFDIIDKTPF